MNKYFKTAICLSIIFLVFLGYRYPLTFDITHHKNNSITKSTHELLSKLDKTLAAELITPNAHVSRQVQAIFSLFQKVNRNIELTVHNTSLSPQEKRAFNLQTNHTLVVTYGDRKKVIDLDMPQLNEQMLANIIYQVLRNKEEWTVFLSGHGELDPNNTENRHLSLLTSDLKKKGINIASLNYTETGLLPDNTKVLVIADSQKPMMPKELEQILSYLQKGGNLLWLTNPGSDHGLTKLSTALGIQWLAGTILDPKAHAMGTPHPGISIIMNYPVHPLTHSLDMLTVFPWAMPLDYSRAKGLGWETKPFLITEATSTLQDTKSTGPYTIGVTLQKGKQRIVVIGNSHFLSNSTIHNYGNLTLANNIYNWLSETDALLTAPTKPAFDLAFTDTPFVHATREYGFPYVLPLGYLFIGWLVKRSRYQKYRFF